MRPWIAAFVLLFAACGSDPSSTSAADAGRSCAEQGVPDADCARCGPAPEPQTGRLIICQPGFMCGCPRDPACYAECENGACEACLADDKWHHLIADCLLCPDAGP